MWDRVWSYEFAHMNNTKWMISEPNIVHRQQEYKMNGTCRWKVVGWLHVWGLWTNSS
jgi:hypothetical protein